MATPLVTGSGGGCETHAVAASPSFEELRRTGDRAVRDALVEQFMPLAGQVARRYLRAKPAHDDLYQVACLGLVKAVDRFDPDRGFSFATYAVPTMVGEIKRYFRDHGWAVRVPRSLQEHVLAVTQATNAVSDRTNRSPTVGELAEQAQLSVEETLEALEASSAFDALSLDAPTAAADQESAPMAETVGREDAGYELVEDASSVAKALRGLPERERQILHLRFQRDMTQSEIAERIGVSQMQVSRLIRASLDQLRADAG